jgi:hypothetical protein
MRPYSGPWLIIREACVLSVNVDSGRGAGCYDLAISWLPYAVTGRRCH